MRKVVFKPYMSADKYGNPAVQDCSSFSEEDLLKMLAAPLSLTRVSFRVGHSIWSEHLNHLFNKPGDPDIKEFIAWMNLGMVGCLERLGYRVIPDPDEIQIL